jgi:DNA-binding LacI/PurR family transcriptional regulator
LVCADKDIAQTFLTYLNEHNFFVPKLFYIFGTEVDCPEKSPFFTIYKFTNELGKDAINILAARLNGKESCTVKHSGKWSVLAVKNKDGDEK